MSTTLAVAFFACILVSAGHFIWHSLTDHMHQMRAMLSKHRALKTADVVTVTVLSAHRFVAAPPPDFRHAVRPSLVFGPYQPSPLGLDHRAARMRDCAAVGCWAARPPVKTGTQWHRPYLPRGVAARSDYRFEPCHIRKVQGRLAAVA